MFATKMGSVSDDSDVIYLRPETAQGIFVNYLNVQKTNRMKIPFGICQIGKAFRNEIVARQFIFRMREFEQMEMEFFCRPGTEMQWFEYWKEERMKWHLSLGIPADKYRYHDHEKLAHYANAATDIEFEFPFGFKELKVFILVQTLTLNVIRNSLERKYNTSIVKSMNHTLLTA